MALDDKYDGLQKLVQMGKEKGYVLYDEVSEVLPGDISSGADLDDVLSGLDVAGIEILEEPKDFEGAFAMMAQQRPDVLLVLQDALTLQHRKQIIDFALRERLPSMFVGKEWVQEGGLMAYGDSLPDRYRRAASFVDRILHGAKPADLPVEQPTKFELFVNLKTAKAIGLTIPETFLARADEVFE